MIKVTNSPNEYMGTSDETKPSDVPKYTLFLELDTGTIYYSSTGPDATLYEGNIETETGAFPESPAAIGLTDDIPALVDGDTYVVNFEGTDYEVIAGTTTIDNVQITYIGDLGILMGMQSTHPFIILTSDTYNGLGTVNAGTYSVKITKHNTNRWQEVG